jgi:hypothetical protein
METKRIQVKYRKKNKRGALEVPLENVVNGKRILVDRSKIDYYGIYCPENDNVYFVELSKIGAINTFTLRFDEPKNNQTKVRFANEFESFNF